MISFRLGSLPVVVRPVFFVMAAVIGVAGTTRIDPARLVLWVAIVFGSVLLHELGHALTARRYGAQAEIELFALGGVTRWHREPPVSAGGRVLIAAAGSAIGITIGLTVYLVFWDDLRIGTVSPLVGQALVDLMWVNLGWGILNWLPIRMLDGGHILAGLLEIWFPQAHHRIASVVFIVSAVALVGVAVWLDQIFLAILFAVFGFSGESRPKVRSSRSEGSMQSQLSGAREALGAGDFSKAAGQAGWLLSRLPSPEEQAAASRILVAALVAEGRVHEARRLVESPPDGFRPSPLDQGRLLLTAGRLKPAVDTLSGVLAGGDLEALRPLVQALGRAGAFTEAVMLLTRVPTRLLEPEPILALASEAERAGASVEAAALRRLAAGMGVTGT